MVYDRLRKEFRSILEKSGLLSEEVRIKAFPLTPQEAIGNPEELDYPLVRGRERLMEADFRGSKGQAFTDLYGDFEGCLGDVLELELRTNYERAVFISVLNAVLRNLGLITYTVHCKDYEPRKCAEKAVEFVKKSFGSPRIFLVGFQPRFAEFFSEEFELRITDLNDEHLGKEINGVFVEDEGSTVRNVKWADLLWITGTTVVNGTIGQFLDVDKPEIFYGSTIAGVAYLLGLTRFCPMSR